MRNDPVGPSSGDSKMAPVKALATFAAFLGIVLLFAFGVGAFIKWLMP